MSHPIFMLADETGGTPGGGIAIPAWLPWGLVVGGVVLLAVVVVLLARGRNNGGESGDAGRARAAAELTDLKNQLVEVKKLAATVAEDLDRRAERLERLIAHADGLIERGAGETQNASDAGFQRRPGTTRVEQPSLSPVDDLSQRVFSLADQGRSAVQIAQALRQPVGNVELMLALRGGR